MKKVSNKVLVFSLICVLFIGACKKDNSTNNNDNNTTPDPQAVERQRVLTEYNTYFLGTTVTTSGWTGDATTCTPGTISQDAINKTLIRINYFRRCVGLNDDITFDAVKSQKCQQAALMMQANNALNHYPPTTWSCWTQDGSDAAGSSNIAMGYTPPGAITAYIEDNGTSNNPVGHRRWVLYSTSKVMGLGHATTFNALWVTGNGDDPVPANLPSFIPWPPKGYIPAPLVYPKWSFSKRLADFTNAQVAMTDSVGNVISLSVISNTDNGFGDNTIVWVPTGINTSSTKDVKYNVAVNNVMVDNVSTNFTYQVIIIQP